MSKQIKIFIGLIVIIFLGLVGYFIYVGTNSVNPDSTNNQALVDATPVNTDEADKGALVGGDVDKNGCLGSAGYSWCQPKNKCLRIWEEACYKNLDEEVQYLLAEKYQKPANEVWVANVKQAGDYASGGVKFGVDNKGTGGLFLVAKIDNMWQIIYDGNGNVDCVKLRQEYKFPDEILKPNFCD